MKYANLTMQKMADEIVELKELLSGRLTIIDENEQLKKDKRRFMVLSNNNANVALSLKEDNQRLKKIALGLFIESRFQANIDIDDSYKKDVEEFKQKIEGLS